MNRLNRYLILKHCLQLLVALAVVLAGIVPLAAQEHRAVYYYNGTWPWPTYPTSLPENIRFDLMTHFIFLNGDAIAANGTFQPPPAGGIKALEDIRDAGRARGVKILYCIPGDYSFVKTNIFLNPTNRTNFIAAAVAFVNQYNLDGLDIDFEYAPTADTNLMASFVTDVRAALGREKLLTAAVAAQWSSANSAGTITPAVVNDSLDWLNIMAYIEHYTVAQANADLNEFANLGVARSKLVLGVPFYGKGTPSGSQPGYNTLLQYIVPFNPDVDFVNDGVNTYNINGRTTQRQKVWLAATNANGTMIWNLNSDTNEPTLSLAVALNEERTNKVAVLDGFEHPEGAHLGLLYTAASCGLATTNDRVGGDRALQATFTFSGAQYAGGSFRSPTTVTGFSFPTNALLRCDLRVLDQITNGTLYLRLIDGAGKEADRFDNNVLRTNGWKRLLWNRAGFAPQAGFNYDDIRSYRFIAQFETAAPASTNRVLFDNFVMFQPTPTNPPVAVDRDRDHDGLCETLEAAYGTDPLRADTDGDGRSDREEIFTDRTNPLDAVRLLLAGAIWRFYDGAGNPGAGWAINSFNDAAWSVGPAPLGYGMNDLATLVTSNYQYATFFRGRFTNAPGASFASLRLRTRSDDGVVVHLNGTEIFRTNVPAGPVSHGMLALSKLDGLDETFFLLTNAPAALLVPGTNILAAQVHQVFLSSEDTVFDAELVGLPSAQGPALVLASTGTLTWPGWAATYTLRSATNLTPPVIWNPVTPAPVLTNGQWRVTVPTGPGATYFRLQSP